MTMATQATGRWTRRAGAALLSLGALLLLASPAHADDCADTVSDKAGVLGDGLEQVRGAAESLRNAVGAEVRVITVTDLGSEPTLDALVKNWCVACGTLASPDGGIKTNLIVFAMSSATRGVGIFYGNAWRAAFSGANAETRIWQDFMVPAFRDGRFAQGFADAMAETQRILTAYLHPGQAAPPDPAGPSGTPSGSQDGRPAGWVVGGGLVAIVGGLGVRSGVVAVTRRRATAKELEDGRQAARAKLAASRDAVMSGLLDLDAARAGIDVAAVYEPVAEGMATARTDFADAVAQANQAILGDTTDGRDDLTTPEYERAQRSYDVAAEQVARGQAAVAAVGRIEDGIKSAMASLPETFTDEAARNTAAQAALAGVLAGGVRVPAQAQADLASLDGDLDAARSCSGVMAAVLPALAALRRKRESALAGVQDLQRQADEFADRLAALTAAVAGLDVGACQATFTQITDGYNEGCWQDAADEFAAVEAAHAQAERSFAAARAAGQDQDWRTAGRAAQDGFAAVDDGAAHVAAVQAVLESLRTAPERLMAVQTSAQGAIDAAWQYARTQTDDDPAHEAEIARAEAALAASAVAGDRPNWILALTQADLAETTAQAALAKCQGEVAEAERRRIEERRRLETERAAALRAQLVAEREERERSASVFGGLWSSGGAGGGLWGGPSSDPVSAPAGGGFAGSADSSGGGFSGSSGSFGGAGGGLSGSSGTW